MYVSKSWFRTMPNKYYLISLALSFAAIGHVANSTIANGQRDSETKNKIAESKKHYDIKTAQMEQEKAFSEARVKNKVGSPVKKIILNHYYYDPENPTFPKGFSLDFLNNAGNNSPDGIATIVDKNSPATCIGVSVKSKIPGKDGVFYFIGSKNPAYAAYAEQMCGIHG